MIFIKCQNNYFIIAVGTLQLACRDAILQCIRKEDIDKLPLPTKLKEFLRYEVWEWLNICYSRANYLYNKQMSSYWQHWRTSALITATTPRNFSSDDSSSNTSELQFWQHIQQIRNFISDKLSLFFYSIGIRSSSSGTVDTLEVWKWCVSWKLLVVNVKYWNASQRTTSVNLLSEE